MKKEAFGVKSKYGQLYCGWIFDTEEEAEYFKYEVDELFNKKHLIIRVEITY